MGGPLKTVRVSRSGRNVAPEGHRTADSYHARIMREETVGGPPRSPSAIRTKRRHHTQHEETHARPSVPTENTGRPPHRRPAASGPRASPLQPWTPKGLAFPGEVSQSPAVSLRHTYLFSMCELPSRSHTPSRVTKPAARVWKCFLASLADSHPRHRGHALPCPVRRLVPRWKRWPLPGAATMGRPRTDGAALLRNRHKKPSLCSSPQSRDVPNDPMALKGLQCCVT